MKTIEQLIPAYATHPGTILLDEIIANGFSQIEFAKLINLNRSQLNEIIKGKRNINANLALVLEKALKIDAEYWLEAQKNYELDTARLENKNIQLLKEIEIKLNKMSLEKEIC
ncbi:MAG: HigA family addiction module antitoxin [Aquirufa sp.]